MRPSIKGILETPVYVDDLALSHAFYHGLLGFERMIEGDRLHAYNVAPAQTLIVFLRGTCDEDLWIRGEKVPGHRSDGPSHFAFRIEIKVLADWMAYLKAEGVDIESHVHWPLGGESIYFRDPFNNVVELATGGIWPNDAVVNS
ncbi:VOC family protein [Cohaesibacter celericrescens]|uniref:Glyoxalase n=1 Tax=Cohaesibacter celericrescens TaxID=2067669 RepID=A0A2N5XS88_9HYPH|nr:VOC family protein [Cohaesibacter celericrescens]PLW77278.1 glyoxalase [Cohaesibacter celericrescens]